MKAILLLFLQFHGLRSQCRSQTLLSNLNNVTLASNVTVTVNGSVCSKTYNTGACVDPTKMPAILLDQVNFYKQKAIEARNLLLQLPNATVYWQKKNGTISANATSTSTGVFDKFLTAVSNFFSKTVMGFFEQSIAWVKSLFEASNNSISSCFQAYANITHGASCIITSNISSETSETPSNFWVRLSVDRASTGTNLKSCLDIIDVYCIITHGVSFKGSENAFNLTNYPQAFDDKSTISQQDCKNLQKNWNTTDDSAMVWRDTFLIERFQSNYIPFVPSQTSITNLGSFFNQADVNSTTVYTAVQQNNTVKGIGLTTSASTSALNIFDVGLNSGHQKETYSSKIISAGMIFLVLLALMNRV